MNARLQHNGMQSKSQNLHTPMKPSASFALPVIVINFRPVSGSHVMCITVAGAAVELFADN